MRGDAAEAPLAQAAARRASSSRSTTPRACTTTSASRSTATLRSWAVPKGPSTDPRVKRLAVEVEDHPLEYADFEGVIGEGYGSGAVIVWDAGTYRNLDEERSMAEALDAGHAKVWLEGEKLERRLDAPAHRTAAQAAVAADQAPRRGRRRPAQPAEHPARVGQERAHDRAGRARGGDEGDDA